MNEQVHVFDLNNGENGDDLSWPQRILRYCVIYRYFILVILIALMFFGIGFGSGFAAGDGYTVKKNTTCTNFGCIEAAKDLIDKTNLNTPPCQDFYEFSCGGFLKKTILPEWDSVIDTFTLIEDINNQDLRVFLKNPLEQYEPNFSALAKKLYHSCMNQEDIDNRSLTTVQEILSSFGGMPILNTTWDRAMYSWPRALYNLMLYGVQFDFFFRVKLSPSKLKKDDIKVELQPHEPLEYETFLIRGRGHPVAEAYYIYMVRVLSIMGALTPQVEVELQDVINFEIELHKLVSYPVRERDPQSVLIVTIEDFMQNITYINMVEYINSIIYPHEILFASHEITIDHPHYFIDLGELLQRTDARTIANFIGWRVIRDNMDYLPENLRDFELVFDKYISGITAREPRYKQCVKKTTNKLSHAVGEILVRNVYKKSSWELARNISELVKQELINSLKTIAWMDEKTRKIAADKAEAIKLIFGSEDELDEWGVINYYKNLSLNPTDYFGNILNISKFDSHKLISGIKSGFTPIDEYEDEDDVMYAPTTDGFYSYYNNTLKIPASLLMGSLYRASRPQCMNFGALGTLVAHSMIRGFDQRGRMYDSDGNNNDLWDPFARMHFDNMTTCYSTKYMNISIPEIDFPVDPISSESLNLADNIGIKLSYNAYKKWIENHGEEMTLPGLPKISPAQLFWISYAHQWCTIETTQHLRGVVLTDFMPSRWRVNVPLQQNSDFAKDFRCEKGSQMNPEEKCQNPL